MAPEQLYCFTECAKEGENFLFEAQLNPEYSVFEGHFPGNPVLPGVCTLRLVRDCVSAAVGEPVMLLAVKSCKFLGMVVPAPDAVMQVSFSINGDKLQCRAVYRNQTVLKLSATIGKRM
ncbi:MAG: beta-hydroxyacyl-ACP dehydratase [Bacteroides sp.]|nr:beta-hydroxyacyl-ACP dehydratase [Bacteroides sp.]MCM1555791.1 beta-hydroxyacyl-ACP dehydratase [Bacteroides sp.]